MPAAELVTTQEEHAHRVVLTQVDAKHRFGLSAHESIGHLQQQTAAVAGAAVCGNPATVCHAGQRLNCRLQQAMTGLALNMGD
jgi:hypothetical protein